jgi:hypothetical protein
LHLSWGEEREYVVGVRVEEFSMKPSAGLRLVAVLIFVSGSLVMAQQGSGDGASFGVAAGLQQGAAPAQKTVLRSTIIPVQGAACPVSLRAQHLADGSMVQTANAHPKGLGQWLHLTLANLPQKKVAVAQITVHGFSDKARMTQTSGSGADASRTMTVPFIATGQTAEADVWIAGMTAVQTIDLHSVAFDDGSESFAGAAGCQITPDPLMLIAAH